MSIGRQRSGSYQEHLLLSYPFEGIGGYFVEELAHFSITKLIERPTEF